MALAPTGTARASVLLQIGNGDIAVNVFHVRNKPSGVYGASTSTFTDTVMSTLRSWYVGAAPFTSSSPSGYLDDSTVLRTVTVRSLDLASPVESQFDFNEPCGASGALLPYQDCIVITWRTALATRSGRGRTYFGPLKQSILDTDGNITATARTNMATYGEALRSEFVTLGTELNVYSRLHNTCQPVTSCTVDTRIDIQRRRANRRVG